MKRFDLGLIAVILILAPATIMAGPSKQDQNGHKATIGHEVDDETPGYELAPDVEQEDLADDNDPDVKVTADSSVVKEAINRLETLNNNVLEQGKTLKSMDEKLGKLATACQSRGDSRGYQATQVHRQRTTEKRRRLYRVHKAAVNDMAALEKRIAKYGFITRKEATGLIAGVRFNISELKKQWDLWLPEIKKIPALEKGLNDVTIVSAAIIKAMEGNKAFQDAIKADPALKAAVERIKASEGVAPSTGAPAEETTEKTPPTAGASSTTTPETPAPKVETPQAPATTPKVEPKAETPKAEAPKPGAVTTEKTKISTTTEKEKTTTPTGNPKATPKGGEKGGANPPTPPPASGGWPWWVWVFIVVVAIVIIVLVVRSKSGHSDHTMGGTDTHHGP